MSATARTRAFNIMIDRKRAVKHAGGGSDGECSSDENKFYGDPVRNTRRDATRRERAACISRNASLYARFGRRK